MRRIVPIIPFVALLAAACSTEAVYNTKDVTLTLEIRQVSAGFCEAYFRTDKDAYFYVAAEEAREGVDPLSMEKQFKTLSLDLAYKNYINWRYEHLLKGEPHIAEFSSHSLQYVEQDYFFNDLKPDTDYWIYGFVVDPKTNSPCGDLILQTIHTKVSSEIEVWFEYRINGTWDYIYPLDTSGNLNFFLPWVGETVDSVHLRDVLKVTTPGDYFISRFKTLQENGEANIFYGMYAHNNDGIGDGTSHTLFEEGHTYYTALSSFDGPIIFSGPYKNYNIYKFKWVAGMDCVFDRDDDTLGVW
ncbi:MAG: hypothetical protein ACI395_06315 [Candidatus Cryptobacteroides sp.]